MKSEKCIHLSFRVPHLGSIMQLQPLQMVFRLKNIADMIERGFDLGKKNLEAVETFLSSFSIPEVLQF